jgi:hypothetical protein
MAPWWASVLVVPLECNSTLSCHAAHCESSLTSCLNSARSVFQHTIPPAQQHYLDNSQQICDPSAATRANIAKPAGHGRISCGRRRPMSAIVPLSTGPAILRASLTSISKSIFMYAYCIYIHKYMYILFVYFYVYIYMYIFTGRTGGMVRCGWFLCVLPPAPTPMRWRIDSARPNNCNHNAWYFRKGSCWHAVLCGNT